MCTKVQQFLSENNGNSVADYEPRPPVPGEETEVASTSTRSSGSHRSLRSAGSPRSGGSSADVTLTSHSPAATPRRSNLADKPPPLPPRATAAPDKDGFRKPPPVAPPADAKKVLEDAPLGFEPEGSASSSPQFTENSTPGHIKWAEDIQSLLLDLEGVVLYEQFLNQEHKVVPLDFWFSCQGLKIEACKDTKDKSRIRKTAYTIYKKHIESGIVDLTAETRQQITETMLGTGEVDLAAFCRAQQEVEDDMKRDTYPRFLQSALYLTHVQNGGESPKTSVSGSTCALASSALQGLQAVPEGEQLNLQTPAAAPHTPQPKLTSSALMATRYARIHNTPFRNPDGVHPRQRPLHPYYVPHVSYTNSAQDSMSSDALTDDTLSATDSSIDGRSVTGQQRRRRRPDHHHHHHLSHNTNLSQHATHVPRNHLPKTDSAKISELAGREPAKFAEIVIEKLKNLQRQTQSHSAMQSEFSSVSLNEGDSDSILDDHFSRIHWDKSSMQTPRRSPGRLSPDRHTALPAYRPHAMGPNVSMDTSINKSFSSQQPTSRRRERMEGSGMVMSKSFDSRTELETMDLNRSHTDKLSMSVSYYGQSRRALGTTVDMSRSMYEPSQRTHGKYPPGVTPGRHLHVDSHGRRTQDLTNTSFGALSFDPRRSRSKEKKVTSNMAPTLPGGFGRTGYETGSSGNADSGVSTGSQAGFAPNSVGAWILDSAKRNGAGTGSPHDRAYQHKRPAPRIPLQPTTPQRPAKKLDKSGHFVEDQPKQPIVTDPQMPQLESPNTATQLEEAIRRLNTDQAPPRGAMLPPAAAPPPPPARQPYRPPAARQLDVSSASSTDGTQADPGRSSSRPRSAPSTPTGDRTVVGIYFCGDDIPYRYSLPGRDVTLRQIKTLLTTKGNFRYFFKTASDEFGEAGVVQQEVSDDDQVVPMWDGKVVAKVEKSN